MNRTEKPGADLWCEFTTRSIYPVLNLCRNMPDHVPATQMLDPKPFLLDPAPPASFWKMICLWTLQWMCSVSQKVCVCISAFWVKGLDGWGRGTGGKALQVTHNTQVMKIGRLNYRCHYNKPLKCNLINRLSFPLGKCNTHGTCYTFTIRHGEQHSESDQYGQIIITWCNGSNLTKHPKPKRFYCQKW